MDNIFFDDQTRLDKPTVATIGFFDGVHRGHRYLINRIVSEAETDGMESIVITFDRHPRQVLQDEYQPKLLTPLDDKLLLLSRTKVNHVVVLHFDKDMAALSAREFMQNILFKQLNVRKLFIGYDNRFGHDRTDGFDDYVRYGREIGMEVVNNPAFSMKGVNVSSSVVRKCIEQGEIEMANSFLGYPYSVAGKVVGGFREGRKLGFPTANLSLDDPAQLIPAHGVYAVKVRTPHSLEMKRGMTNIGVRPTFEGIEVSLETHILNFSDDIYGQQLRVFFVHRIRDEHKFDSLDELSDQLKNDKKLVSEQFDKDIDYE